MGKTKRRLNWYIIVFIVINIMGLFFIGQRENVYVNKNLKEHSQDYQNKVKTVMDNYKHSFQLFSQILTDEIKNHPEPDQIWDYLKTIDRKLYNIEGETFDGLYMYYQGHYLYSWDTPYSQYESTGYDATERPWYKDALKANGEIVFTPPYMSYANHYILSTMSQLQPDGKTVFAYDIKMGDIQNIVTSLQNYDDEIMMIYDNNGTIIGSSRENYLGGNLKDSLEQSKVVLNDANQAVKDAKDLTQEQIQKLQEEADYAKAFYQFKEGFYDEYQGLLKTPQKSHLIQVDHTYYYSYLLETDDYHYLIMVPLFSMLKETMQVWLVPVLVMELLLIYILSQINKGLKNRELKAAYVELGQTQKRLELALSVAQKAAAIDELTGMMNLKSFRKAVIDYMQSMEDDQTGILIMIDGDHFKKVNDDYGHPVGDEVIKLAAQMIVGRIRTVDFASRLHGDEFAMFITNTDDYEVAKRIMDDINTTIAKESKKRNMPKISLSSGAVLIKKKDNYSEMVKLADEALYEAKKTHDGGFAHANKE